MKLQITARLVSFCQRRFAAYGRHVQARSAKPALPTRCPPKTAIGFKTALLRCSRLSAAHCGQLCTFFECLSGYVAEVQSDRGRATDLAPRVLTSAAESVSFLDPAVHRPGHTQAVRMCNLGLRARAHTRRSSHSQSSGSTSFMTRPSFDVFHRLALSCF